MHIVYPVVGLLSGLVTALVLHRVTGFLRLPSIVRLATGLGWCVFAVTLTVAVFLISVWLSSVGEPFPGVRLLWGMLGMFLLALVGLCYLLGTIQARRHGLPWGQAFGVVMTKVGFAIAVGWFLQENLYNFADVIRGGSREVSDILESFRRSREMLGWSHLALGITLLFLEFAPPFPVRPGAKP